MQTDSKNSFNSPFSKTANRQQNGSLKLIMKNMMDPIDEVQHHLDYSISDKRAITSNKKIGYNSQEKFMNHFYTINDTASKNKKFVENVSEAQTLQSNEVKYLSRMQQYQSTHKTNSVLDDILYNTDNSSRSPIRIDESSLRFIHKPILVSMDNKAKYKVTSILNLFNKTIQNNNFQDVVNQEEIDLLYLKNYAHVLANLPNTQQTKKSNQLYRGKPSAEFVDASAKLQSKQMEVNTDPQKDPVGSPSQSLRKIDILLIEIMREKKRRGLVQDYFKIMEMKLIELLDYILADEEQYHDLELTEKMKLVLKNLQKFKGKTFEGQLKINLLRIFFQQFRNLKLEKMNSRFDSNMNPIANKNQHQQSQLAKFMLEKQHTPNFANKNIKVSEAPKKSDKMKKSFKNKEENDKNLLGFSFNPKPVTNYQTMSVDGASFNNNKVRPQGPITYKHSKSIRGQDQWIGELV